MHTRYKKIPNQHKVPCYGMNVDPKKPIRNLILNAKVLSVQKPECKVSRKHLQDLSTWCSGPPVNSVLCLPYHAPWPPRMGAQAAAPEGTRHTMWWCPRATNATGQRVQKLRGHSSLCLDVRDASESLGTQAEAEPLQSPHEAMPCKLWAWGSPRDPRTVGPPAHTVWG